MASEDLRYEIIMAKAAAEGYQHFFKIHQHIQAANMAIESFATHIRSLLDFLYLGDPGNKRPPYKSDVIAEDFFGSPEEWHLIRPSKTESLKKHHNRAHKRVAHLTYDRQGAEDRVWDFNAILVELLSLLRTFQSNVPSDVVSENFRTLKF